MALTDNERKNRNIRIREKRLRQVEAQNKELKKRTSELENISKQYPPMILTLMKRLKRIDPWNSVAGMDPMNCAFISYYKLRQTLKLDNESLRIVVNTLHTWVEFKYDDKWWVFDPIAVNKLDLGYPIKLKSHADKEEYKDLSRNYYDMEKYLQRNDSKIKYTTDEAKIAAMEDTGLNSVLKLKYH